MHYVLLCTKASHGVWVQIWVHRSGLEAGPVGWTLTRAADGPHPTCCNRFGVVRAWRLRQQYRLVDLECRNGFCGCGSEAWLFYSSTIPARAGSSGGHPAGTSSTLSSVCGGRWTTNCSRVRGSRSTSRRAAPTSVTLGGRSRRASHPRQTGAGSPGWRANLIAETVARKVTSFAELSSSCAGAWPSLVADRVAQLKLWSSLTRERNSVSIPSYSPELHPGF
jgi:hypothetical protein